MDIAVNLAETGNAAALKVLFSRHKEYLVWQRRHILSHLPDWLPVEEYEDLIPSFDDDGNEIDQLAIRPWRQRDWIEEERFLEFLELILDQILERVHKKDSQSETQAWHQWFETRIKEIESRTGLADVALDLADLALSRGFSDLELIRNKLSVLTRIIYSGLASQMLDLGLSTLDTLPTHDLLRSIIILVDLPNMVALTKDIIIPYLSLIQEPFIQLKNLLVELSCKDLDLIASLLSTGAILEFKRIANDVDIKNLVLDCAYAYEFSDGAEALSTIASYLNGQLLPPVATKSDIAGAFNDGWVLDLDELELNEAAVKQPSEAELDTLSRRALLFNAHLTANDILSYYGIGKPIGWYIKGLESLSQQMDLVKTLMHYPAKMTQSTDLDQMWLTLLEHFLSLQSLEILPKVSKRQIYSDVATLILREGRTFFLHITNTHRYKAC